MKNRTLAALMLGTLLVSGPSFAAKVPVSLTTPTTNTDGTPLTDLASIEIEWGTCNGTAFGVKQASRLIGIFETGVLLQSFVYPTGMTKVCVRAFAINMKGVYSAPSNVASKDLIPGPDKPVTLGQPIILSFNKE